ncbi:hypothetical protein PR202_gb21000 [Eleusine coracana subsp. coracana]|uniref:Cytochrome P450 716B1 n=1 Tax=Eleusine coracana subsp. coracana TaxID=191504 RepID=A0AAV5FC44_ELECO|nr:hypothetical protein PR202_gb21000 [Eleusine coracana subsp. coracana]
MLRLYVGKIDGEVRRHIDERWEGRSTVTVMPLMKRLTFDIITSLLFGLERGPVRDALAGDFERVIDLWSVVSRERSGQRARGDHAWRSDQHDEVAKGKGDGEALLTWEDLGKMKFTWRVAQETLRVVPPVFDNFRTAIQDVEFGGYTIPKGWQVFWTAGVTHMDAAIFPEPHKFDPSRFENNQSSSAPPCSFVAFGGGPRICVGMEFARIETLVTMHHLLRRFRWRLCCKEDTFARDPMPTPLHGLPIEIEHRTYY